MSNEQIAAGLKLLAESTDELLLSRSIKIDHDVSAQDQRKHTDARKRLHQVRTLELNEPANLRLDTAEALGFSAAAQEILFDHDAIHALDPLDRIDSPLAGGDCPGRDIRCHDPYLGRLGLLIVFERCHREGIRLLARRTRCAPDVDSWPIYKCGKDHAGKKLEVLGLAKEASVVGGQ